MPGPWVPCLLTRPFFLVCSSSGQKLLVILERRGAGSEGSRTFLGPMLAVNMQAWPHQQDVVLRVRGAEALASPRGRFWVLWKDVCVLGPEAASRWCPLGSRGSRLGWASQGLTLLGAPSGAAEPAPRASAAPGGLCCWGRAAGPLASSALSAAASPVRLLGSPDGRCAGRTQETLSTCSLGNVRTGALHYLLFLLTAAAPYFIGEETEAPDG